MAHASDAGRRLASRNEEGEGLLFRMGGAAADAILVGLTPGALEVAHPMAYLVGKALVRLDPYELTFDAVLLGVVNQTVILVDDGLLHPTILLAAVRAIRRGAPRRLIVAAPVLGWAKAFLAAEGGIDRIVEGLESIDPLEHLPFEGEAPPTESQAHDILDHVNRRDEGGWAMDLIDVRIVAGGPQLVLMDGRH